MFKGSSLIRFATMSHLLTAMVNDQLSALMPSVLFLTVSATMIKILRHSSPTLRAKVFQPKIFAAVFNSKVWPPTLLIAGDICQTADEFIAQQSDLSIALLHIDVDVAAPTEAALAAFWPHNVPGGLVVLTITGLSTAKPKPPTPSFSPWFNPAGSAIR